MLHMEYTEIAEEELRKMLQCFNADDYNEWALKVCCSLKSYSEEASYNVFAVFDEWSQSSSKYNAREVKNKWDSFDEYGNRTIGSLIEEAITRGFIFENQRRSKLYNEHGIITLDNGTEITKEEYAQMKEAQRQSAGTNTKDKKVLTPELIKQGVEEETKKLKEKLKGSHARNILPGFIDDIKTEKTVYSTGYKSLDNAIGGGLTGGDLTIIAGETGTGKTAGVLQMAENIARNGNPVIYFTLEISSYELIARSLSRQSFINELTDGEKDKLTNKYVVDKRIQDSKNVFTSLSEHEIMFLATADVSNEAKQHLKNAKETYSNEISNNLYVYEAEANTTIDDIVKFIEYFIETKKQKPVVFIDYMQLIKPSEEHKNYTEKQHIDYNISMLKSTANKHRVAIVMISSINRANYGNEANNGALKGSGDLEYTASTVLLLNYRYMDKAEYCNGSSTAKGIKENKKVIRQYNGLQARNNDAVALEMKVAKNRHGVPNILINFDFFGKYGLYIDRGTQNYSKSEAEEHISKYKELFREENKINDEAITTDDNNKAYDDF